MRRLGLGFGSRARVSSVVITVMVFRFPVTSITLYTGDIGNCRLERIIDRFDGSMLGGSAAPDTRPSANLASGATSRRPRGPWRQLPATPVEPAVSWRQTSP